MYVTDKDFSSSVFYICYIYLLNGTQVVFRLRVWFLFKCTQQVPQLSNVSCAVRHSHVAFTYVLTPILLVTAGVVLFPFGAMTVLVSYGSAVVVAFLTIYLTQSSVKIAKSWGRMREVRILKEQLRLQRVARERLKKQGVLKNHELFSDLIPSSVDKLIDVFELKTYKQGDYLCKQGDVADRLFVIISGELYVDITNESGFVDRVATVKGKDKPLVGESSIIDMSEHYRTASLLAASSLHTLEVTSEKFFRLMLDGFLIDKQGQNTLHQKVQEYATKARKRISKKGILQNHEAFKELETSSIDKLLNVMTLQMYNKGSYLCKHHDLADRLFVLISGSLFVDIEQADKSVKRVATIKAATNPVLGEQAILNLNNNYRTASLLAASNSQTLEIKKENWFELMRSGCLLNKDGTSTLDRTLRELAIQARVGISKKGILQKSTLFGKLKKSSINRVLEVMSFKIYTQNEMLCRQNEIADCLYLLLSGTCDALFFLCQ